MTFFHADEYEGYKNLYAQTLIQAKRDLSSTVQMCLARTKGEKGQEPVEWYETIGKNLTSLKRDRKHIDPSLQIPTLSEAVRLWLSNELLDYGCTASASQSPYQSEVNFLIHERIDTFYNLGDLYLTALSVSATREFLVSLAIRSGLKKEQSEMVVSTLCDEAEPICIEAWKAFENEFAPSNVSLFRPSKKIVTAGQRKYFKVKL